MGASGVGFLLRGAGAQALYKRCVMFGMAVAMNVGVLVLNIFRLISHYEVEFILLVFGMLVPAGMFLTFKAALFLSKKSLKGL